MALVSVSVACRATAVPISAEVAAATAPAATAPPTTAPPTTVPPTTAPQPTSAPLVEPPQPAAPTPTTEQTTEPAPTVEPTPIATPPEQLSELLLRSSLGQVECPDDVRADRVTCSIATLPLDQQDPVAGGSVEIMVAFVDNGDPNGVGPLVYLQGGPGIGSITNAPIFVGASHDVLFVDQRGTGYSTPRLTCPEVDTLWEAQYSDDPEVRLASDSVLTAAYSACGKRLLAEGINFDHFNTRSAATDIELLRQLFGYDQWSIWGVSYGTRLGLTIMRDHPEGVRAAVLDSVVPFEVDFFATIPKNAIRAIGVLDEACDADQCVVDHGGFLTTLSELVVELNESPIVVTATRPVTGREFPFRVDGEQLLELVFTQLYSTRALRSLPRQISRAEFGGLQEIVAAFVSRRDPNQFDLSIALYYSTWCREEFPFYDRSADDELLVQVHGQFGGAAAGALSSDGVESFCDVFAVSPAAAVENMALVSPIPTLVFAGRFDPITPPSWSQQVAQSLPNSVYVEMPDHGHGMATSCPATIRLAFLMDPSVTPNISCAEQTGGPDFE